MICNAMQKNLYTLLYAFVLVAVHMSPRVMPAKKEGKKDRRKKKKVQTGLSQYGRQLQQHRRQGGTKNRATEEVKRDQQPAADRS